MKTFFRFILVLICSLIINAESFAQSEALIETEENIKAAGTIQVSYKKPLTINEELLSDAVSAAVEAKKNSPHTLERKPKVTVQLNLYGAEDEIELIIDYNIADLANFVDEIAINSNGVYCYIQPAAFSGIDSDKKISIKDTDNIIEDYNGAAPLKAIKKTLIVVFVVLSLFLILFMIFVVGRQNFKKGFNRTAMSALCCIIAVLCLVYAGVLYFIPLGDSGEKHKLTDGIEHPFEVFVDSGINDVYIGLPLFEEAFDPNYLTAVKKGDTSEGEKILGGRYGIDLDVLKFKVTGQGSYYMRNNKVGFTDIKADNKGLLEAVEYLASKNIVSGKAEGVFGAEDHITRAEIVTMLCQMLALDTDINSSSSYGFSDVSNTDWFYKYVMTAKQNGLLAGYADGTFHPADNITNEQMAGIAGQFMVNRLSYFPIKDTIVLNKFKDKDEMAVWAEDYYTLLERENLGIWEDYCYPKEPLTRGEAAIMLYRLYLLMD